MSSADSKEQAERRVDRLLMVLNRVEYHLGRKLSQGEYQVVGAVLAIRERRPDLCGAQVALRVIRR